MNFAEFRDFVSDSSLFQKKTKWKIKNKLREGISKTIKYVNKNYKYLK